MSGMETLWGMFSLHIVQLQVLNGFHALIPSIDKYQVSNQGMSSIMYDIVYTSNYLHYFILFYFSYYL